MLNSASEFSRSADLKAEDLTQKRSFLMIR